MQHEVVLFSHDSGPLQDVVDGLTGPATIVVAPGLYDLAGVVIEGKEPIVLQSARLSRRGVVFTGGRGRAMFDVKRSTLHLSGIEIRSCATRAIVAEDAHVSTQECVIASNRSDASGAGVAAWRSVVHLQKSVIGANVVRVTGDAFGGGVYLEDCRAEIAGCTIELNELTSEGAAYGGGLACVRTKLRLWRSRITDNALHGSAGGGGGIYVAEPLATQIGGCVITGNHSFGGSGGGVFAPDLGPGAIHRNTIVQRNHPDDVSVTR